MANRGKTLKESSEPRRLTVSHSPAQRYKLASLGDFFPKQAEQESLFEDRKDLGPISAGANTSFWFETWDSGPPRIAFLRAFGRCWPQNHEAFPGRFSFALRKLLSSTPTPSCNQQPRMKGVYPNPCKELRADILTFLWWDSSMLVVPTVPGFLCLFLFAKFQRGLEVNILVV